MKIKKWKNFNEKKYEKIIPFFVLFVKKVKNNKINMHAYETAYAFSSENDTCKVHLGKKTKGLVASFRSLRGFSSRAIQPSKNDRCFDWCLTVD